MALGHGKLNDQFWHIPFNRLAELNEQLVKGREDLYFGFQFAKGGQKLPDYAVKYYIDTLASDPDALHGSFRQYRAFDTTIEQNEQRKTQWLTMPFLAIGRAEGSGQGVVDTMKLVADDLRSLIILGTDHWVAEEAPEELLAALTEFLAPYRDG